VYFNEIFDGLWKLSADLDLDVKNGAQLLDRLLQDVVTESEDFEVEKFIPLLRERIRSKEPSIRQLVVGWITLLDSVPSINMLDFLPEYLGGLFDMLSDQNKDIRQQAYATLAEFLREITETPSMALGSMVMILVKRCESNDNFTRLTALTWMFEFIQLGKTKLLTFIAAMMGAALHCISDAEGEIRAKAEATNISLLQLVEETDEKFDIQPVLQRVVTQVRNKWVPTRQASLRWLSMLLTKMPQVMYQHIGMFLPVLFQTLSDADDGVVRLDLQVLAQIALDKTQFDIVLEKLIQIFSQDRVLLEKRGSLIIRRLSVLLDGESIFRAMATILAKESDLDFASLMVQTLNLILLTSAELFELRKMLKDSLCNKEGRDLFVTLYKSWVHNPVATFSLCLLAQVYELASTLSFKMADIEVTVGFLFQIDKLVQLIESPIFVHLRLQLLEPTRHPFLIKALYGLLMLLPQSTAYTSLKTRLENATTFGMLTCIPDSKFATSRKPDAKRSETSQLNFTELLDAFQSAQQHHSDLRKQVFRQHSLRQKANDPK
jgi:vacuole morphology and inheritance protein 14